jgi:polyisoprenoid-binding protein YceI
MPTPQDLPVGTWTVDAAHTSVSFTVKHLMISKVRGAFAGVSGQVVVPEDRFSSTVEVTIDPATVDTRDPNRDNHLRAGDFFDIANHPTWTFRSSQVRPDGDDEFVLVGDLTIRGVTRPVELEVEFSGVSKDPWGNLKAGFEAEAEINRKDWGLEYNAVLETGGVVIGEKVKLHLDVQLQLQP